MKVLSELDVFEITATIQPANSRTRVVATKGLDAAGPPSDNELRHRAAGLGIRTPLHKRARDQMLALLLGELPTESERKARSVDRKSTGATRIARFEC